MKQQQQKNSRIYRRYIRILHFNNHTVVALCLGKSMMYKDYDQNALHEFDTHVFSCNMFYRDMFLQFNLTTLVPKET